MTDTRYRTLLWTYAALAVMAIAAAFFPTHSETLAAAYENEPETWFMSNLWVAGGSLVVLAIAWARLLSLCSTLASMLV